MQKLECWVHFLIWMTLYTVTVSFQLVKFDPLSYESGAMFLLMALSFLANMAVFYGMAFWLLPRFLRDKEVFPFVLNTVLSLVVCGGAKAFSLWLLMRMYVPGAQAFKDEPMLLTLPVVVSGFYAILGAGYRFGKDWVLVEAQKRALLHEKTKAELGFLKSQINPHFLFNVLNNLYGLAHREKAEQTSEGILKLADMMRYMLYECQDAKLPLEREVDYLNNYIALQRLRIANHKVEVRFSIEGDISGLRVHPLLMVPLVENAFKHGISNKSPGAIDISLSVENGSATFRVANTIRQNQSAPELEKSIGGFGLGNLRRRLKLLAPEKELLNISEMNGRFEAILVLPGDA